MDELQISGRRYISSRRVAKENGYHTDYIGQLIRGGKVKGQKVGRAWYVDADSFYSYIDQEPGVPASQPKELSVEAVVEKVEEKESAPARIEIKKEEVKESVQEEIKEPIKIKEVEKKEVEKKVEEVKTPIVEKKTTPVVSGGLKYIEDKEPLLPEIEQKKDESRIPVRIAKEETTSGVTQKREAEEVKIVPANKKGRRVAGLLLVGTVIFVFSAVVSSGLSQMINIDGTNPARVEYVFQW